MEVKLSEEFVSDLRRLSSSLQQKCWNILSTIRKEDAKSVRTKAVPGWRMHKLKSSPFTSFSVDMNFRMLCQLDGQIFRACRVVKHDLADVAYINRNDGMDSAYAIDNARIEAKDVYQALVSIGLPPELVAPFSGVEDEDGFVDVLGQVDEHLQTYALALYETAGIMVSRSKYTIFDVGTDFDSVLRGSMEMWELYLHPSQRYIVELPASYRLSVGGAAGTGKTVCAWYRIQHLVAEGHSVGFVCPNEQIFEVSRQTLESLLRPDDRECYFLIPHSSKDIAQLSEVVDHVVVDEGQEFPPTWLAEWGYALTKVNTGLTLFYDLNQLGGNIKPGDTSRLRKRLNFWDSKLNSFPNLGRMELSINYRNSREIAEYWQTALENFLPERRMASIPLFGAGDVVVETVSDMNELGLQIGRVVRALQKDYGDGEIGIILNSSVRQRREKIVSELRSFGIRTTNDVRNKGMILFTSPRDIKGHERKAIVFCTPPIEQSTRKWGKTIDAYVALTRARDRLIVLQSP